ncbi:hypothetical protein Tco_0146491 [Tanacetum coccineum]
MGSNDELEAPEVGGTAISRTCTTISRLSENLEYLVPSDAEAPIEDQPLLDDASPAALSQGYIADSDPEEDPKEDPELDLADYPVDGGDDDDDESSDDDDDDDEEDQEASKDDDEEEEEHLAPADSSAVPVDDHVPLAEDREAFETDESSATPVPSPRRRKARIAAEIRLRAASPSTHHPSEILSLPLLLPSTTHRDDLPEADMPLRKRAHFTTPTGRSRAIPTIGCSIRMVTDLPHQRQESHELQVRCEDAHDDRALLGAQVSLLIRERRYFRSMASSYSRERIRDEDRLTAHIQHEYDRFRELIRTVEAGPYDGPENAGSSSILLASKKMPPKKRTATTTTTTPMIDAQIKELISQGVADALAERDADRSRMVMTAMIQELA